MSDFGYSFLPGGAAFSAGVCARPDHAIVRARLRRPIALAEGGWDLVERWLDKRGRPVGALCGMELRIPAALSPSHFAEFNLVYASRLDQWELRREGAIPVARTNVAAESPRVTEPSLAAFTYTVPDPEAAMSWVLSGIAEIQPDGEIVASGDDSTAGLQAKWAAVLEAVDARLAEMGTRLADATEACLYVSSARAGRLLAGEPRRLDELAAGRLSVCLSDPPVRGCAVELDARALAGEEVIEGPTR